MKELKLFLKVQRVKPVIAFITEFTGLVVLFFIILSTLEESALKFWAKTDFAKHEGRFNYIFFVCLLIFSIGIAYIYTAQRKKSIQVIDLFIVFIWAYIRFSDKYNLLPNGSPIWILKYVDCIIVFIGISFLIPGIGLLFKLTQKNHSDLETDKNVFIPDLDIKQIAIIKSKINRTPLQEELRKIDQECLNLYPFAQEIAILLRGLRPEKAFSVGIEGDWGSGKSSLLEMIKDNLPETYEGYKITKIDFTPWLYPDEKSMIANFFTTWKENFSNDIRLSKTFSQYGDVLSKVEKEVFKTELLNFLFKKESSYKELREAIESSFKERKEIFYFFIDDLDRVGKEEVIEVIRLCRLLANFPNTIYVLAYDRKYIDSAMSLLTTDTSKQVQFFDKIVQIEFKVPAITEQKLKNYLAKLLKEQLINLNLIVSPDLSEIDVVCSKDYVIWYLKNIRSVKRFINNFLLRYRLCYSQVDFQTFFLFELFFFRYKESYTMLYEKRNEWLIICGGSVNLHAVDHSVVERNFGLKNFDSNKEFSILNDIFWNRSIFRSINKNIDSYFVLAGPEDNITMEEFSEWLSLTDSEKIKNFNLWLKNNSLPSFVRNLTEWIINNDNLGYNFKGKSNKSQSSRYAHIDRIVEIITLISEPIFFEDTMGKNSDAVVNILVVFLNKVPDQADLIYEIITNLIPVGMNLQGIKRGLLNSNGFEVFGDERTKYVRAISAELDYPPYNKSHSPYEHPATHFERIHELSEVPWITRAFPLDDVECGIIGPSFLFEREFYSIFDANDIESALLFMQVDDFCDISLNGHFISAKNDFDFHNNDSVKMPIDITLHIKYGKNELAFTIRNYGREDGNTENNPYGFAYKLIVKPSKVGRRPKEDLSDVDVYDDYDNDPRYEKLGSEGSREDRKLN
ncbi:MAG: hypothetical protein JWO03_3470 [Bacteroidetes bacterium]|nr:hypothetical protein [Bacteroidota bacterium]